VNGLIEANQTNTPRGPEHGRWGGNPAPPDLVIRWGPPIGGRGALPRIDLNERGTSEGLYLLGAFRLPQLFRRFLRCHGFSFLLIAPMGAHELADSLIRRRNRRGRQSAIGNPRISRYVSKQR
jgi:hypothetical protein